MSEEHIKQLKNVRENIKLLRNLMPAEIKKLEQMDAILTTAHNELSGLLFEITGDKFFMESEFKFKEKISDL